MADHLTWLSIKRPALDAALAGATPLMQTVGTDLRNALTKAGEAFDQAFPTGVDTGESAAHTAFRASVAQILADLDSLAAAVDGGAATTISPTDPLASAGPVQTRAAQASHSSNALAPAVLLALSRSSPLPPEPPRFAALDAALAAAIATSDAFIAAI